MKSAHLQVSSSRSCSQVKGMHRSTHSSWFLSRIFLSNVKKIQGNSTQLSIGSIFTKTNQFLSKEKESRLHSYAQFSHIHLYGLWFTFGYKISSSIYYFSIRKSLSFKLLVVFLALSKRESSSINMKHKCIASWALILLKTSFPI